MSVLDSRVLASLTTRLNAPDPQRIRLVQITDCHLNEQADGHLLGMNTLHSLQCVLDIVAQEHADLDALLVTGDISQDGSLASYQLIQRQLMRFCVPSFWLAGNHDDQSVMAEACRDTQHLKPIIHIGNWQIVLLDSQVPGKVHGELADSQLLLLDQALAHFPQRHTLVCFHHHPIDMDSRWLDTIGIFNRDALHEILARHPKPTPSRRRAIFL